MMVTPEELEAAKKIVQTHEEEQHQKYLEQRRADRRRKAQEKKLEAQRQKQLWHELERRWQEKDAYLASPEVVQKRQQLIEYIHQIDARLENARREYDSLIDDLINEKTQTIQTAIQECERQRIETLTSILHSGPSVSKVDEIYTRFKNLHSQTLENIEQQHRTKVYQLNEKLRSCQNEIYRDNMEKLMQLREVCLHTGRNVKHPGELTGSQVLKEIPYNLRQNLHFAKDEYGQWGYQRVEMYCAECLAHVRSDHREDPSM